VSLQQKGSVFNIQKFCVSDGPGIRTTVFFKGCPLNCIWCHNPESKETVPELSYNRDRCTLCKSCVEVCKTGAHLFKEGIHTVNRDLCKACGMCETVCINGAVEKIGRFTLADEVMEDVLKDKVFYRDDGGMTLSGGEPFMQYDFAMALLEAAKKQNINTCVETCGYVNRKRILKAVSLTDLFLYDYKLTDENLHKRYVGVDNKIIIGNLLEIDKYKAKTILRCPVIPGINDDDEHFSGIADLANHLKHIVEINIMPYHPLGESKSDNIGKKYPINDAEIPAEATVSIWIEKIKARTAVDVKKG
jgi:glycyl-radical enzyme activating protein